MIAATNWTVAEIGELTMRQLDRLLPRIIRCLNGEEPSEIKVMSMYEALKTAGAEQLYQEKAPDQWAHLKANHESK